MLQFKTVLANSSSLQKLDCPLHLTEEGWQVVLDVMLSPHVALISLSVDLDDDDERSVVALASWFAHNTTLEDLHLK